MGIDGGLHVGPEGLYGGRVHALMLVSVDVGGKDGLPLERRIEGRMKVIQSNGPPDLPNGPPESGVRSPRLWGTVPPIFDSIPNKVEGIGHANSNGEEW